MERYPLLFLCNSVIGHALSRFRDLAQHILASEVSGAENAGRYRERGAIPPEPVSCCGYHS